MHGESIKSVSGEVLYFLTDVFRRETAFVFWSLCFHKFFAFVKSLGFDGLKKYFLLTFFVNRTKPPLLGCVFKNIRTISVIVLSICFVLHAALIRSSIVFQNILKLAIVW